MIFGRARTVFFETSPAEWPGANEILLIRFARQVSNEFTVPLCRGHHREVHRCGDEAAWWSKAGVDPTITARSLC
jgi:hypothetical protein